MSELVFKFWHLFIKRPVEISMGNCPEDLLWFELLCDILTLFVDGLLAFVSTSFPSDIEKVWYVISISLLTLLFLLASGISSHHSYLLLQNLIAEV
jgi:hypothetical protein